ncbi:MAG: hypothetical protein JNL32_00070 [Candidatus Kapabacteria bacterium]|nr:hypothetical protein [Candidatus Kapabacteria bacterium]
MSKDEFDFEKWIAATLDWVAQPKPCGRDINLSKQERELLAAQLRTDGFTFEQANKAYHWISRGQWNPYKKSLEYSDFFPYQETIPVAEHNRIMESATQKAYNQGWNAHSRQIEQLKRSGVMNPNAGAEKFDFDMGRDYLDTRNKLSDLQKSHNELQQSHTEISAILEKLVQIVANKLGTTVTHRSVEAQLDAAFSGYAQGFSMQNSFPVSTPLQSTEAIEGKEIIAETITDTGSNPTAAQNDNEGVHHDW